MMADVESKGQGKKWFYSDVVKQHFMHPKNILIDEKELETLGANGIGEVGSPACGDVMKMWLTIKDDRIKGCRWQTFGCASAIASTSMLSVMLTENGGMKLDDALKIRPKDILDRLHGLPVVKIHCSVLGDQAVRSALNDYFRKTGQEKRVVKVRADHGH